MATILFLLALGLLPAAARGAPTPPIAPTCPADGPGGGALPVRFLTTTGGHRLAVCGIPGPSENDDLIADSVSVLDVASVPPRPLWKGEENDNRYRLVTRPERGFEVRLEALLRTPESGRDWFPVISFSIECDAAGCRVGRETCALPPASGQAADATGRVRILAGAAAPRADEAINATDDLLAQALRGDDPAVWLLERLEAVVALDGEARDNLSSDRALFGRARDAGCGAPKPDPAATEGTPEIVRHLAFLAGGRWEGRGSRAGAAGARFAQEWGWTASQRALRFTQWNLAGDTPVRLADGLVFQDGRRSRPVVWILPAGGGLVEESVAASSPGSVELESAGRRERITRFGAQSFSWRVQEPADGTWGDVLSARFERRP